MPTKRRDAVHGSEALETEEQERVRRLEALANPDIVGTLIDPEGLAEVLAQREQHVLPRSRTSHSD